MPFQYEDVILPNRPLVLVSRDWGVNPKKPQNSSKARSIHPINGQFDSFKIKPSRISEIESSRKGPVTHDPSSTGGLREGGQPQSRNSRSKNSTTGRRKKSSKEAQTRTDEWHSSSNTSSEDGLSQLTLLESLDEAISDSRCACIGKDPFSSPFNDAPLLRFAQFEVPSFVTKTHYLSYYVERIGNVMYPLTGMYKVNPLREFWLPLILSDEMWFYTILYSVARHFTAGQMQHNSSDAAVLASLVIPRLRNCIERNTKGEVPTDIALAAIACMAATEHAFGTKQGFNAHIQGLSELIKVKGGVDKIDSVLRTKICRADLEGAVDNLSVPLLPPPRKIEELALPTQLKPGVYFLLHPTYDNILRYLSVRIAAIATEIHTLAQSLDRKTRNKILLDPFTLDNQVLCLNHTLCGLNPSELTDIDEAFRIASLIFLKALMRPFDVLALTSSTLITKLHERLIRLKNPPKPLMLWLLYMGMLAGGWLAPERFWMMSRVITDMRKDDDSMPGWLEVRSQLQELFWADEIFDRVGEKLWREVEAFAKM